MSRTKVIEFLENKETYSKVLEYINRKTPILTPLKVETGEVSSKYFIAGGSVANTLYFIYNDIKNGAPVINDVDIFKIERKLIDPFGFDWDPTPIVDDYSFLRHAQPVGETTVGFDDYHGLYKGYAGETIKMLKSARKGLINIIDIEVSGVDTDTFDPRNYYNVLLDNFDINSCSAGLDLIDGKILYTEDFVEFLVTNKLEISKISNPVKSFVRLHKKMVELKCECDIEAEYDLLRHSYLFYPKDSFVVGMEWSIKLRRYQDLIKDRFFITNKTGTGSKELIYYQPFDFEVNPMIYFVFTNYVKKDPFIEYWNMLVRGKYGSGLRDWLATKDLPRNMMFSNLMNEGFFSNIFHSTSNSLLNGLITPKNYFKVDFKQIQVEDLLKFKSQGIPVSYVMCDNIIDHVKLMSWVSKNFVSKTTNEFDFTLFRRTLNSMTEKEYKDFNSKEFNSVLRSLESNLNSLWIKNKRLFRRVKIYDDLFSL